MLVVLTIHEASQYHPRQYCHSCQARAQGLIEPCYWSILKWISARAGIAGKFFHQVAHTPNTYPIISRPGGALKTPS